MNAINLLKQDHRNVEALFERFESADDTARQDVLDKIIEHLSVHAAIEETVFYPAVRAEVPDLDTTILDGLEEHHVTKWLLDELTKLPASAPRASAKVKVLRTGVEHHVAEEESAVFPRVLEALSLERLEQLGEMLTAAKETAPTRPHPRMPDQPPLNLVIGMALSLVDKAVQTGRETVARVLHHTTADH